MAEPCAGVFDAPIEGGVRCPRAARARHPTACSRDSMMPVVRTLVTTALTLAGGLIAAAPALAQEHRPGGEANLILPDLNSAQFLGVGGHSLLLVGLLVSALGLLFGLAI